MIEAEARELRLKPARPFIVVRLGNCLSLGVAGRDDRERLRQAAVGQRCAEAGMTISGVHGLFFLLLRAAAAQAHPVFDVVVDDEVEFLGREAVVGSEDGVDLVEFVFVFSVLECL